MREGVRPFFYYLRVLDILYTLAPPLETQDLEAK